MVTVTGETAWFDVDDTLIYWFEPPEEKIQELMEKQKLVAFYGPSGQITYYEINLENLKQVYRHYHRGHKIIVFSDGGGAWAEKAVKALGIEDYVTLAISKPRFLTDDRDPKDWHFKRFNLTEERD